MLEYLSLHTKVRRLGYLKLLVILYFDRDFIPVNSFDIFFEKKAGSAEIQKQLKDYSYYYRKDDKGIIDPLGTGVSADPYIQLADNLSIIAKSNYSYILTKYGKIYKVILERYQKESHKFKFIEEQRNQLPVTLFDIGFTRENLFILNALDKLFFLKQILEKDFIYTKAILNIINRPTSSYKKESVKYENIKKQLISELKFIVTKYLDSGYQTPENRARVTEFEKKLSNKHLRIRSYESIVEPRINWLLDLDIIDSVKHSRGYLELNSVGRKLVSFIEDVFDIYPFIEEKFISTFSSIYNITPKKVSNPEVRIEKYLNYAFTNFKTLAPNRIAASQAFSYISFMCFLRDGILLEYNEIKNYIFSIDGKGYSIDWFPSENDGSIKRQKND